MDRLYTVRNTLTVIVSSMLKSERRGNYHPTISFNRVLRRRVLSTPSWDSQKLDRMRSGRPWTSSLISTNTKLKFLFYAELALSRDTVWPISSSITLTNHPHLDSSRRAFDVQDKLLQKDPTSPSKTRTVILNP